MRCSIGLKLTIVSLNSILIEKNDYLNNFFLNLMQYEHAKCNLMCHFNVIFQATKRKAELQMSNFNDFFTKRCCMNYFVISSVKGTYSLFIFQR